ncbi:MAG: exosortase/archaeosortase family protein [Sedimentisphaerales bacterium]|nr:exosortase/archaeosortase family protein [Sedimentisphaerales bacterium]
MAQTLCTSPACLTGTDPSLQDRRWAELGLHSYVKIVILGGLFCFLFHSELAELIHLWATDSSWSHGFLIPLFSLYFLNQRRREILSLQYVRDPLTGLLRGRRPGRLSAGQTRPDYLGLLLLLGILACHVFNVVSPSGYAYLRPLSVIAALGAVVLFLGGWRLVQYTWLPIAFLVFAVPLPRRYYEGMTIPLRQISASVATALLNVLAGVDATASGVVIDIVYKGHRLSPALDVAEACSGMRLLMAFVALGVAMAYLHERPAWQRVVLLVSTVPIAVLCNVIRVAVTGFLYVLADPRYTQGVYHDALGLAMLPLAFVFYGLLATFLSNLFVEEEEGPHGGDVIVRRPGVR